MMPPKERNIAVKQQRAYHIVQRRLSGASLSDIAKELNISSRTLTRDLNANHYRLLCDELLQQQLQTIRQLPPKDACKPRQDLLKLIWPKTCAQTTTITVGVNNNNHNNNSLSSKKNVSSNISNHDNAIILPQQSWQLDPTSQEYKNYSISINSYIDQQLQDTTSPTYSYYQTYIETRVNENLKDPTSQTSKDYKNILQSRIDTLIDITPNSPTLENFQEQKEGNY